MTTPEPIPMLADPDQASAHVRAVIDPDQLTAVTALVVFCDELARPTNQWHILDCDIDAAPAANCVVLDELLSRTDDPPAASGLVLGLTRPGGEEVQAYDRSWFRAYHRFCHRRGLTPYGVYTVTRIGARPIQIDDAA